MISKFIDVGSDPLSDVQIHYAIPIDSIAYVSGYEPKWNEYWYDGEELFACIHIKPEYTKILPEAIHTRYGLSLMLELINHMVHESST